MVPYRVKYNESEYDIQNNDLWYKIDQQCQNTFEMLKSFEIIQKNPKIESILALLVYFVQ